MEDFNEQLKKTKNWKSTGNDQVYGYFLKRCTFLHRFIVKEFNDFISAKKAIPSWLTCGRTTLIVKDQTKSFTPSNFRPITCLSVIYKTLTGIISSKIYEHLNINELVPNEQRGCIPNSRGTKDQLIINKEILKTAKTQKKNLFMAYIDYKKAFDSVPHSWIIACLKSYGIAENIIQFLSNAMRQWNVELFEGKNFIGSANISNGIFQGDSLSPLLFIIALFPLTSMLKTHKGFRISNIEINHLLYVDDIKVYTSSEKNLINILKSIQEFSDSIHMQFGIEKCKTIAMKKGNLTQIDNILTEAGPILNINSIEEHYKYLGVEELLSPKEDFKQNIKKELVRKVTEILNTHLNSYNTIDAISIITIP